MKQSKQLNQARAQALRNLEEATAQARKVYEETRIQAWKVYEVTTLKCPNCGNKLFRYWIGGHIPWFACLKCDKKELKALRKQRRFVQLREKEEK